MHDDALPTEWSLGSTLPGEWNLRCWSGVSVDCIGSSREGRTIFGLRVGTGPLRVSITAGAHADEPVGPRAALLFVESLMNENEDLAERATFRIVPHANPDGDARNAAWQRTPGDLTAYVRHVVRESPIDDVEFHYPDPESTCTPRPENEAIAAFLRAESRPVDMHASLHSMGFAEGAWFLLCREWSTRHGIDQFRDTMADAATRAGLGLHDWDRSGEKGFSGLGPGFSTTPRGDAMRAHFLALGDTTTAAHFGASSMDFVQSLGGDPLCLVSELPAFAIAPPPETERIAGTPKRYLEWREAFASARAGGEDGLRERLEVLAQRFGIRPVPWQVQARLQIAMIRAGIDWVESTRFPD